MSRKFTFSARVTKFNRAEIKQNIIQAAESSPELRKEISRIFQQANRRIQNVEKSGVFSPAVASLGDMGSKYTKFGISGKSWTQLKMDYGKAVSFLNQPTSTATGARSYNLQIMKRYDLTEEEFGALASEYTGKITSLTGTAFVEKYLKRYKDFSGDFETAMKNAAQQMETEAVQIANGLQSDIEQTAENIARIADTLNEGLNFPF